MHGQSASRTSGRTKAAVFAMCVQRVLITNLKSAGTITRVNVDDVSAAKFDASNLLCPRRARFLRARNFRFAS
jgi:hypothetical protein